MGTGIELIAKERQEQIGKHGWDADHDLEHYDGALKNLAIYLLTKKRKYFPNWDKKYFKKNKTKTGIEALKVAGALIAAEIDRLQNQNNDY